MQKEFRQQLPNRESDESLKELQPESPFQDSIRRLKRISKIEAPICKLEHIYQCCVRSVKEEIEAFWHFRQVPQSKLSIDSDSLQGILIYMLFQVQSASIISELELVELFLPESVQASSRSFYLCMLKQSIDFIVFDSQKYAEKLKPKDALAQIEEEEQKGLDALTISFMDRISKKLVQEDYKWLEDGDEANFEEGRLEEENDTTQKRAKEENIFFD